MKTPLYVMLPIDLLTSIEDMAKAKKKTRTAMVTELLYGTSKLPIAIDLTIQGWFDQLDGVTQADIDDLKAMIKR